MRNKRGFTLIELLVVIGILSILAVALLIAINPAEAQRKARDTQRLKDLSNIQAALEGWLNDTPGSSLNLLGGGAGNANSTQAPGANQRNCSSGWLGLSVCNYLNRLPIDPRNTTTQVTDTAGVETNGLAAYYVRGSGGVYNICTFLESKSNAQKLLDDGYTTGATTNLFNVYSSTSVGCP